MNDISHSEFGLVEAPPDRPSDLVTALGFQQLEDLGGRERGIAAEVAALHLVPISRDHRLQHLAPAVGAVHVAGRQRTPLQVAELVEQLNTKSGW
jgi:hypothetical protein